jgi:LysM repeat protein
MMFTIMIPIKLRFILSLIFLLLVGGCTSVKTTSPTDPVITGGGGFPRGNDPYSPPSGGMNTMTYHTVAKGDTLASIARRYGYSYQEIAQWNGIAPPYTIHPGQQLRISPVASSPTMGAMGIPTTYPVTQPPSLKVESIMDDGGSSLPFSTGETETASGELFHVVLPGESIYGIASRYNQNWQDVALWNSLEPPYHPLPLGRRLQVTPPPGWAGSGNMVATNNTMPPSYSYSPYSGVPPSTTRSLPPPRSSGNEKTSQHVVQPGDTLYNIAKRYGRRIGEVAAWNGLSQPYTITVGQTLLIKPGSGKKIASATPSTVIGTQSSSGYHTVAAGDTLYNIAKRYGQTVAQVAALNNIQPPYTISLGQRLQVGKGGSGASAYQAYNASNHSTGYAGGSRVHQVKAGETLYSIARLYGITSHELAVWNGISPPYNVFPGLKLRIVPP